MQTAAQRHPLRVVLDAEPNPLLRYTGAMSRHTEPPARHFHRARRLDAAWGRAALGLLSAGTLHE
ncbi:hypothetical protein LILAB_02605 [Corallococcus macrosporus]|uniref:Uncharacterized protein n=1 Tax=Myxococcus fulvus (strain ATCC BAA-855 / HW-1) TaxID=483219 RepID=F8CFD8_MYXFH|nr:hypothetical protein LILAB_02605 [Corallococcus macrosporus]